MSLHSEAFIMTANLPPKLAISPPLVNSSNPWATTLEDLTALYECPHTGAVTTRTSLIGGFAHDPSTHQFTLFDSATHKSQQEPSQLSGLENASLNTLGYSPLPLDTYLSFIRTIATTCPSSRPEKGFIVSVTGNPLDIVDCYRRIAGCAAQVPFPLAMEINLSCPNIPGKPPPAYDGAALSEYLVNLEGYFAGLEATRETAAAPSLPRLAIGLKTPPYTHASQFAELLRALEASNPCPVSFLTATNTLGSCLVLSSSEGDEEAAAPALPGAGIGGMAGAPLHPLALGNVRTLRRMLDESAGGRLAPVQIVGVGGVLDHAGYRRMRAVGAEVVGVGTGLGMKGVGVFGEILG